MKRRILSFALAVTLAFGLLDSGTAVYAQENEMVVSEETETETETEQTDPETSEGEIPAEVEETEAAQTSETETDETVASQETENETPESEAGEETAEIPESYTLETETAETGGKNGETETGEETSETAAETESSTEETAEDETISIVIESSAKTATASAGSVSINSKNVTIYGLDSWAESYISIPSGFAQTYQLKVTGASSVTYTVTSGDCVTVSSKGVISPVYETWYWYGSVGTTYESSGYTSKTTEGNYGSAVIKVVADSTTFTVKVKFVNYAEYYAEQVMQDYIDDNITSGMSTYEKVEAITAFVAENYDYSASYSSVMGMIVSGGG